MKVLAADSAACSYSMLHMLPTARCAGWPCSCCCCRRPFCPAAHSCMVRHNPQPTPPQQGCAAAWATASCGAGATLCCMAAGTLQGRGFQCKHGPPSHAGEQAALKAKQQHAQHSRALGPHPRTHLPTYRSVLLRPICHVLPCAVFPGGVLAGHTLMCAHRVQGHTVAGGRSGHEVAGVTGQACCRSG